MLKLYREMLLTVGTSMLLGCGGGSGDSDSDSQPMQPTSPSVVSIEASVVQSKALVNMESDTTVHVSSDIDFRLTSVEQVGNGADCEVTSIDGMTFTTLSDQIGECQFEYTVEPIDQETYLGQAASLARVSVSETAENNTLPNLSETTNVESTTIIDLSQELENELDTSIFSVSEDVTLLGTGSVEVDSQNNTITYTPTDIGVTRIMYSMTDGTATKLGNIDVAVSDIGNTPPVANDYVREGKLAKDMSVEIDLTDYVSDVEDSVFLDSVRAYNAETEITSTTEHTFTFQSSEPGPHEVAYTVTDGRGGYAVGQVYIEVEPDFDLVQDWEDITIYDPKIGADLTFRAPASKVLADYTNTAYTSYQTQDGISGPKSSEVVTMKLEQAQAYCASRNGRLPISREWELLLASQGNLFESNNWPAGAPFWSADMVSEASGISFLATDGSSSEILKHTGAGFVTCVMLDNKAVQDFSTSLEYHFINGVTFNLDGVVTDPDGNLAPFQNVKLVSERKKGVFSNHQSELETITDANGELRDSYSDTSFNDEVISGHSSASKVDSIVFRSEADRARIAVNEQSLWNSRQYHDAGLPSADEKGLLVQLDTNNHLNHVYKNEFRGENFIAQFQVVTPVGQEKWGELSFTIQQVGNDPNQWVSSQLPEQDGVLRDESTLGISIQYYYNGYYLVKNGVIDKSSFVDADAISTNDNYIWIIKEGSSVDMYVSVVSDRPENPMYSFEYDTTTDYNQPYWLTFGGDNTKLTESRIASMYFGNY